MVERYPHRSPSHKAGAVERIAGRLSAKSPTLFRNWPTRIIVGVSQVRYSKADEPLAQMVEHLTFNQGVVGSSPTRLTKYYEDF